MAEAVGRRARGEAAPEGPDALPTGNPPFCGDSPLNQQFLNAYAVQSGTRTRRVPPVARLLIRGGKWGSFASDVDFWWVPLHTYARNPPRIRRWGEGDAFPAPESRDTAPA